ncbi:arylsulfatase B-like [Acropora muricata]|uniref:arylsulfatase B-like n=1 Tax=Acropora muricata TaxID=159855 RepID=UPI0034E3CAC5
MEFTMTLPWFLCLLGILTSICDGNIGKQPHIIFILADDLGWDDVSFHGSHQIPTPNIDAMANDGVILNNYYVSPMCTPTRASIMTGKLPIHLGLQHFVIFAAQPYGLPLKEVTIAQHLQKLGYKTHAVGKWHLGYFTKEYTPLYRGFDSFFGFLGAKEDYYDHSSFETYWGYDLRDNMTPVRNKAGVYATHMFTEEAIKKINAHDVNKPMFLYLAHQAVHSANKNDPLQAPDDLIKKFEFIQSPQRRKYAAMVTALDESVGQVRQALADKGMLQDSVIIFTTDNGGAPHGLNWNAGSNWPLRGGKATVWEGGVKGVGFVYAANNLIKKKTRVCTALIDATDWAPTLYHLGGGNAELISAMTDGTNVWDTISQDAPSPRDEILHNIDPRWGYEGIRKGNFKLVVGMDDSFKLGWDPPYKTLDSPKWGKGPTLSGATIDCGPWTKGVGMCDSKDHKACLFNMDNDPCEYKNIADQFPLKVQELKERLNYYRSTALPVQYPMISPKADPKNFDKFWSPWEELADKSECDTSKAACDEVYHKQHSVGFHRLLFSNYSV